MNYLSLILRIVAILSAIAAGFLYFLMEGKLSEKEKKLAQARAESRSLLETNESVSLELSELQENLTEKTKLAEATKVQLEEAQAKLVAETQESQRLQKKLIETQKKVTQLEEMTTRLREELVNAETLFAAASQESLIAQLKDRIDELTAANDRLRKKVDPSDSTNPEDTGIVKMESKTNSADSDTFVARALTPDEVSKITEAAKVASLSVSNGVIVLDTGNKFVLAPKTTVDLIKASRFIARIEIINANSSLAIAYIKPGAKLNNLSKGDTVNILR